MSSLPPAWTRTSSLHASQFVFPLKLGDEGTSTWNGSSLRLPLTFSGPSGCRVKWRSTSRRRQRRSEWSPVSLSISASIQPTAPPGGWSSRPPRRTPSQPGPSPPRTPVPEVRQWARSHSPSVVRKSRSNAPFKRPRMDSPGHQATGVRGESSWTSMRGTRGRQHRERARGPRPGPRKTGPPAPGSTGSATHRGLVPGPHLDAGTRGDPRGRAITCRLHAHPAPGGTVRPGGGRRVLRVE